MLALAFAEIIDRHDAGMVELGGGFGFLVKALHLLRGRPEAGADHLEGDDALQFDLPGFVDHAHAAMGDLPQQLVIAKGGLRGVAVCRGFFLRPLIGGYVGEGGVRCRIRGQLGPQGGQVSIGFHVRKRLVRLRANRGILRLRFVGIRRKHERTP